MCHGGPLRVWPRVGGPKFRSLFSLSRPHIRSFCPSGPPGFHTTVRELQTRTFGGPGPSNTTKIPREDTQRETKRAKMGAGEEKKKARNFGPPTLRGPIFSGFGPHSLGHHHDTHQIQKCIGPNWIGQNWFWPKLAGPRTRWPKMDWPKLDWSNKDGQKWIGQKRSQPEGGPGLTFPNVKNDAGASTIQHCPCFFRGRRRLQKNTDNVVFCLPQRRS